MDKIKNLGSVCESIYTINRILGNEERLSKVNNQKITGSNFLCNMINKNENFKF